MICIQRQIQLMNRVILFIVVITKEELGMQEQLSPIERHNKKMKLLTYTFSVLAIMLISAVIILLSKTSL